MKSDNELIAKFMGYKHKDVYFAHMAVGFERCYRSSWDWLMPVVEKIEGLGETEARYGNVVDISTTHVKISTKVLIDLKLTPMSKLDAVYSAIVQFIKWYNEK